MKRQIKIPNVRFSGWVRWNERESIKNIDYQGIYLLAKFRNAPKGPARALDQNVIYFGETSRKLRERWREFNNTAFKGKFGHSGGRSYREIYRDQGTNLFIAAFPFKGFPEDLSHWFRLYLERKLIWGFVSRYGSTNLLNRK